jgi:hypothetical protein
MGGIYERGPTDFGRELFKEKNGSKNYFYYFIVNALDNKPSK